MYIITLNQNNIVPDGQNNKLVYNFPNSTVLNDKYVAIVSISMYYSWFNITTANQNNNFTYTWTSGAVTTTYTVTIPDGLYEITQINNYFQWACINNGTYYVAPSGDYVYPLEFILNPQRYAVQINTYLIPTSLPALYSEPANFAGWPSVEQNSVITLPSSFNVIVGYTAGFSSNANVGNAYVPPASSSNTNYVAKDGGGTLSYLSNTSPQVQPNNNVLVGLSTINNPYSQPSSIIYSLNPNVSVGEQIFETPPNFAWCKLIDGVYNELRINLYSNTLQPLLVNDPNMTFLLAIRDANEGFLMGK